MKNKILIVDDDLDVLTSARILLKRQNFEVLTEPNPEKIPFLINSFKPDVILLDMNFKRDVNTGKEGIEWLKKYFKLSLNQLL